MIKKLLITILLLSFSFWDSFADVQKIVSLNNYNHKSEDLEIEGLCIIHVSIDDVDANYSAKISASLENITYSKVLCLFNGNFNESQLKKRDMSYDQPSIIYGKEYPGSKGTRITERCSTVPYPIFLQNSDKGNLFYNDFKIEERNSSIIKIPIYVASYKNKKKSKLILERTVVLEVEIQIEELKRSPEYVDIAKSYDDLIREIDSVTFCKNEHHPDGERFTDLYRIYESKIEQLKKRVAETQFNLGYSRASKAYLELQKIHDELDMLDLEKKAVDSCPKDIQPKVKVGHRCKYCSMSYEDIYSRIQNISIDIYNGTVSKDQVMAEVEALHKCVIHNTRRKGDKDRRDSILRIYNIIKSS